MKLYYKKIAVILMVLIISIWCIIETKNMGLSTEMEPDGRKIQGVKWIKWYGQPYVDGQLAEGEALPSSDEVFPDDELQKAVSALEAELPLDSNEKIIAYMEQLKPILIEFGYLPNEVYLANAQHFCNVWIASYTEIPPEIYLSDQYMVRDGEIYIYLSDVDGHVIDVEDIF